MRRSRRRGRSQRTRVLVALGLAFGLFAVGLGLLSPGSTTPQPQASAPDLGRCPATLPPAPTASDGGDPTQLVSFTADQAQVCLYKGLNDSPPGGLASQADPSDAAALADALNALPAPPAGPTRCPNDDRRTVVAVFAGQGRTATLDVGLTGCQLVTNGRTTRTVANDHATLVQLVSAAGADPATWAPPPG